MSKVNKEKILKAFEGAHADVLKILEKHLIDEVFELNNAMGDNSSPEVVERITARRMFVEYLTMSFAGNKEDYLKHVIECSKEFNKRGEKDDDR